MRKAAKVSLMVLLALSAVGMAGEVSATPPRKLYVDYNPSSQTLKLIVVHPARNPLKHYIDRIRVTRDKDKDPIAEMKPERQTAKRFDLAIFLLKDVRPGQTLKVKASCNYFGSKTASLDIEQKALEKARKAFEKQEKELKLGGTFDAMYKQMIEKKKTTFPFK